MKFILFNILFLAMIFSSCGKSTGNNNSELSKVLASAEKSSTQEIQQNRSVLEKLDEDSTLIEYTQLERSGAWIQGMGFSESIIRENAGDYAGAVIAAYKELSWAYNKGIIQKSEIEQSILNVITTKHDDQIENIDRDERQKINQIVTAAANAVLAFEKGKWNEAETSLARYLNEDDDIDSFGKWMILVCALEKDSNNRRASSVYRSIRARYTQFPEYWYRGARVFTGSVSAEYAEICINLSVSGPYSDECRKILAVFSGLNGESGVSIKTKNEIEMIIANSIKNGNPQLLESLFSLIGLPENPYTVYAVGALKALNSAPVFKEYFASKAASSNGRLAERLSYISRS